jgi:hypothetical protein
MALTAFRTHSVCDLLFICFVWWLNSAMSYFRLFTEKMRVVVKRCRLQSYHLIEQQKWPLCPRKRFISMSQNVIMFGAQILFSNVTHWPINWAATSLLLLFFGYSDLVQLYGSQNTTFVYTLIPLLQIMYIQHQSFTVEKYLTCS